MSSAKTASRALSPAVPSPSSTCWQKPWVVAIVAASKSASARPMRSRRTASSAGVPARQQGQHLVVPGGHSGRGLRERRLRLQQPHPHALPQLAGRGAGEGDHQELLERCPVGHVARHEARDRVRLAGAGARLEQGHADRQRAVGAEGGDRRAHRFTICSCARSPLQRRRASRPKRVGSASSHPGPDSSGAGASCEKIVEGDDPSEHQRVGAVLALAGPAPPTVPGLRRDRDRVVAGEGRLGVGRGGRAVEGQRLPHAAVEQVHQDAELRQGGVPPRGRVAADRLDDREARPGCAARSQPADDDRAPRPFRLGGAEGQEADPCGKPMGGAETREGDVPDEVVADPSDHPDQRAAARKGGVERERARLAAAGEGAPPRR